MPQRVQTATGFGLTPICPSHGQPPEASCCYEDIMTNGTVKPAQRVAEYLVDLGGKNLL